MLSRKKSLRDSATGVADQLRPHLDEARKKAAPAVSEARGKAEPALREAAGKARGEASRVAAEARSKAGPAIDEARRRVQPALDEARETASPYLSEARRQVEPALDEARRRVQPALEEARTKAAPLAHEARRRAEDLYDERVLPGVATAVHLADDATSEFRHEAGRRGSAAVAALKGEVDQPQEGSRVRKLLVVVGLAGAAGLVAKKLGDRQAAQAWESAYTRNPPRPAGSTDTPDVAGRHRADDMADDTAGGNPGEAVADGADVPHASSTPDAPADVVDVENDKR